MVKQLRSYGVLVLAGIFVIVFGISLAARAQSDSDLTSDKLDLIKMRCGSSQIALQQIEKRDAVSRINRGRAYDQMLRQISAFNSRFAYNKMSSPDLIQITSDLQGAVDVFRASYDKYDTDLTDAMKINCKQKPADYYTMILKARDDRSIVGSEVDKIVELTSQYRTAIVNYRGTVE